MNALEAKQLSKENSHRLAEKQLKEAIENIKGRIEEAANDGEYEVRITISRNSAWFIENNSPKLIKYFSDKGFNVYSWQMFSNENFTIRWDK